MIIIVIVVLIITIVRDYEARSGTKLIKCE